MRSALPKDATVFEAPCYHIIRTCKRRPNGKIERYFEVWFDGLTHSRRGAVVSPATVSNRDKAISIAERWLTEARDISNIKPLHVHIRSSGRLTDKFGDVVP